MRHRHEAASESDGLEIGLLVRRLHVFEQEFGHSFLTTSEMLGREIDVARSHLLASTPAEV